MILDCIIEPVSKWAESIRSSGTWKERQSMENIKKEIAPVLPVPGTLLLPGTKITLQNLSAEDMDKFESPEVIALPLKHDGAKAEWNDGDFHSYGVLCAPLGKAGENSMTVQVMYRVLVEKVIGTKHLMAFYEEAAEENDLTSQGEMELIEYINGLVSEMASGFQGGGRIIRQAEGYASLNPLMTYLAQFMQLNSQEKYDLLAAESLKQRALRFIDCLLTQRQTLALNMELKEKFSQQAGRAYREQAIRRQIEALKEELGETTDEDGSKDLKNRIVASDMPDEIKKDMLEQYDRLEAQSQPGAESDNIRTYIEFALSLPWKHEPVKEIDLKEARRILNSRHYGLDKVKERIIQHLAVMRLRNTNKGSALLLVGPPGTGKTSLGKSIAQALDRPYVRMSLGGIRDESEIRGHRRTYVGAMAGRILQSMKKAQATNPVMILDEIDKLMQGGFSGDPAAAMLEVLDPEQNDSFTDHYLDEPYDLSDVFFIATANSLDTIPGPLLDRMEVIEVTSYTADEKFHIAKDHLIPEVLADHGIRTDQLEITDSAITSIVDEYTMEAGCRGLKKRIAQLARHESEKIIDSDAPVTVSAGDLEEVFGAPIARHDKIKKFNPAGVVTGLAWTAVGGEVLFIETGLMPGNGQMILTGQLGDVMKESARIALSVLKSRLPIDTLVFKDKDLHIHFPAGATPKDGPSAGITIFTALASLALNRPVDPHIAMTGEISLRGNVLPIGGLKEKLYGALRAGIRKVLIPVDNVRDLREVDAAVKAQLDIVPVATVEDVLREALEISMPDMVQALTPHNIIVE